MSADSENDRERFFRGGEATEALRIIGKLREAGFVAYLAGGCVRDALLGIPPKDFDVATNATPDSVRQVFGRGRTLAFGASFGVIGVLPERGRVRDSDEETLQPTEVATFRSDGTYSDGRRPDSVHYGNAQQDALRRDFTINGLFYDPDKHEIIDFVGGQQDLRDGILRTIGDATTRIEEDKLRMLRAVRFATTLGFQVDPETIAAIISHADSIAGVSGERIGAEMRRVLISPHVVSGLGLLQRLQLHRVVLPELDDLDWKYFPAIVQQLSQPTFPISLACLLVAMPHSLAALTRIQRRWRLSNEEIRQVRSAIEHWPTVRDAQSLRWSKVQPVLVDRDAESIVEVAAAIVAAEESNTGGIELARQALNWPREKLDPPPLLRGDDLRDHGIEVGPAYRTILQTIRDAQLDGTIASKEEAIAQLANLGS